ncbi:MAG: myotubularin family protein [archaeon]|nr:myotubularin family protein [archaeon]
MSASLSALSSSLSASISGLGTSSRLSTRLATAVGRQPTLEEPAAANHLSHEKRHEILAVYSPHSRPFDKATTLLSLTGPDSDLAKPREYKFKPTTTVDQIIDKWFKSNKKPKNDNAAIYFATPSGSLPGMWLKNDYPLYLYDIAASGQIGPLEIRIQNQRDSRYFTHLPLVVVADNIYHRSGGPAVMFLDRSESWRANLRDLNTKLHLGQDPELLSAFVFSPTGGSWVSDDDPTPGISLPEMTIIFVGPKPVYQLEVIGASREIVIEVNGTQPIQSVLDQISSFVSILGYQVQTASGAPPVYFLSYLGAPIRETTKPFTSLGVKQSDILELRAALSDLPEPGLDSPARSLSRSGAMPAPKGSIILRIRVKSSPAKEDEVKDAAASLCAYTEPLPGETILRKVEGVTFLQVPGRRPTVLGDLFITNMHVAFAPYKKGFPKSYGIFTKIPLFTIAKIEKIGSSKAPGVSRSTGYTPIDVLCKDFRQVRIGFDRAQHSRSEICTALNETVFPSSFLNTSAFDFKVQLLPGSFNGWEAYIPEFEQQRVCIPQSLWRITTANAGYELCDTYPNKIIVPEEITDQQLADAAKFRSKGRIPILSYYHPNTATITRCSQPMPGLTGAASPADQALLESIRKTNKTNSTLLFIYDCRPKANAMGQQAMGNGYESVGIGTGYANCKLEFLNIANIHVMRKSMNQIYGLVADPNTEPRFLSLLEASGWLTHVSLLLGASARIAHQIDREGISVLIHCSDGWDRTAQISSLSQIMLSDMYRTIEGFQILIEKDWLSMGHKFHQRLGHGDKNLNDEQRSPIFPQFIDAVWQLLHQFPCAFEFNEKFLLKIMDALYSCHYGTFLCNSEYARRLAELKRKTVSLWTDVARHRTDYVNLFYMPEPGILLPSTGPEKINLWSNYYFRWKYPTVAKMDIELRANQMISLHEQEKEKTARLEKMVADLQSQLQSLTSSASSSQPPLIQPPLGDIDVNAFFDN